VIAPGLKFPATKCLACGGGARSRRINTKITKITKDTKDTKETTEKEFYDSLLLLGVLGDLGV
jgi:hypothetical protein